MLEWIDTHDGAVLSLATLVLVAVTAYYAWTTRALVRETHTTLQASARATLQGRMDRISEIFIREPRLFQMLDDPASTGEEEDARFHISNIFLGILEEAFVQHALERTMADDDWSAWQATADMFLPRCYVTRYWQRVAPAFEPSFQRFVAERLAVLSAASTASSPTT
jgi:hypothetical protein